MPLFPEKSCIPKNLNLIKATSSEIILCWDAPPAEHTIIRYQIRHRECTGKPTKWDLFETKDNKTDATIIDLKAGTEYEVQIRAVNTNEVEGPDLPAIKVATIESLANKVRLCSTLQSKGSPLVYLPPIKHEEIFDNKKAKARKYVLGMHIHIFNVFLYLYSQL